MADYPSSVYANSLMNNPKIVSLYAADTTKPLAFDSLKRNIIKFSVFYGDLGYERYEELANMRLIDLVSNIGGTVGLFLGMSFLSFLELFDIILQILVYIFKKHASIRSSKVSIICPK